MGIIYKNGVQYGGTVDAANMHVDIGSSTLNLQTAIQNITGRVAPIESNPTTNAYTIGDLLVFNGMLYEATAAISAGDTLVIGTNIASTTVDDNKLGYNDIVNNVITDDSTKVASASAAKLLNDGINTLNSKRLIQCEWYVTNLSSSITIPAHSVNSAYIPQYTTNHPVSSWAYIGSLFMGSYNNGVIAQLNSLSNQTFTVMLYNITTVSQTVTKIGNFGVYQKL